MSSSSRLLPGTYGDKPCGMREMNFDGLVGPTHNYGGLSPGNVASMSHGGQVSNPKEAAQQGLRKMAFVRSLGLPQGVLPPQDRPKMSLLKQMGMTGSDEEMIAQAAKGDGQLLRLASSAAAMWTANAATVGPSADTIDGRLHFVPANLSTMLHRSIEASTTQRILQAIFLDPRRFAVHAPVPAHFGDEGAANHTRLETEGGRVHLCGWGKTHFEKSSEPKVHPARQAKEASMAVARLLHLHPEHTLMWQPAPRGNDAGA